MKQKNSGVRHQLLVIAPFLLVLSVLVGLSLLSVDTLSAVRAFVGGESLYSKGQKDAVLHLQRYVETRKEDHYLKAVEALAVPMGDRQARIELDRPRPDLGLVWEGFVQGGNHPDDIDGMVRLYRNFRNVSFMADAIAIWAEGDEDVARLRSLMEDVRLQITASEPDPAELRSLMQRVTAINDRLTALELRFSGRLGEASRMTQKILLVVTLAAAAALAVASVLLTRRTLQRQESAEQARLALALEKESAERTNRAKDEFLSRVSHELRTPLNAILGFAQLMQCDEAHPLSAAQSQRLLRVLQGGRHLLSLVDDILDLSAIQQGGVSIAPREIELRDVADASLALVDAMRETHAVRMVCDWPARGPRVYSDPLRLQQVLVNLLSNAIKYNRPGGEVRLECRVEGDVAHPSEVALSVRDTGPGLSADQLAKLFQPFERLGAEYGGVMGNGLGLVIARQLVMRLGGRLDVESQPGAGSNFTVHLPVAPA